MIKSNTIIIFLFLIFTSCAPVTYYQLYETKSVGSTQNKHYTVFEDEYCRLSYDLWSKGGDAGFTIYNKTDDYITLDLSKSFFVVNGEVYDYYLDRRYTVSSGATVSAGGAQSIPYYWSTGTLAVGASSSTSSSSSISEKDTRILPPKTYLKIKQFAITNFRYRDCDFVSYPASDKFSTVTFEPSESPYHFYNLINYLIDDSVSVEMKNEFYVEKISNYPKKLFIGYYDKGKCGETYRYAMPFFMHSGSDKFYLEYKRAM